MVNAGKQQVTTLKFTEKLNGMSIFCFSCRDKKRTTTEKLIKMSLLLTLSSLITTDVGNNFKWQKFSMEYDTLFICIKKIV